MIVTSFPARSAGEVGDLAEGVDPGEREHRRAAQRRERRDEPRVLGVRRPAAAQQLDELERGRKPTRPSALSAWNSSSEMSSVQHQSRSRPSRTQRAFHGAAGHARERHPERRRAVLAVGVLEHHRHNPCRSTRRCAVDQSGPQEADMFVLDRRSRGRFPTNSATRSPPRDAGDLRRTRSMTLLCRVHRARHPWPAASSSTT